MKRFIVLLFAATAALFVSCDKEEATVLEGEWLAFEDYYHPLYITFEGNNYIWDVRGIAPHRDAGTFTYDGEVLTLNAKEFWEMNDESGKLNKVSSLDSPAEHKYKVLAFDGDILISKNLKDDFFYQGKMMYWTRGKDNQSLDEKALKGTWIGKDDIEDSTNKYIFIFDGSSYTYYSLGYYSDHNWETDEVQWVRGCVKEQGTWKHTTGMLSLTPSHLYYSFKEERDEKTNHLVYTYYPVDEETGEAETWVEAPSSYLCNVDYPLHLSGNVVYVSMDGGMQTVAFTKK